MEDKQIIELYFRRSESAIEETAKKYGVFLRQLAYNILHCQEDSEEITEDTYMKTWNSIPPARPKEFKYYISRIARSLAVNRLAYYSAQRRSRDITLLLSELDECISDRSRTVEAAIEAKALGHILNSFLSTLEKQDKALFLARYYYARSIPELAESCSMPEHKLKYRLSKLRKELRTVLEREGIS